MADRPTARHLLVLALTALLAFALGALLTGPSRTPSDAGHAEAAQVWTCSMHPNVRQPEPGACPLCGMDLIPAGAAEDTHGGTDHVVLSDRAQTLAQLRTTPVRRRADTAAEVRLLGMVEPDETTQRTITAWIGGRIERLHVNTTGERVRAGQPLASVYSPEVFSTSQDLIAAREQLDRMQASDSGARDAAAAALRASRERLALLGIPASEIATIETAERPSRTVPIRTPFPGTVIERLASEGDYIDTGAPLYRLADLSRLWVQLDAYEGDLPRLATGQRVEVIAAAAGGAPREGRIAFIDPTLDRQRRTARVRVELPNPDGLLRPGMFVEATVQATVADGSDDPLVIPDTAPLFTGRRAIVYVETERAGARAYEPRTVRLGPRMGAQYPVVAGLTEGERVVSRGAFVLDADLQIRGGPSMMTAPDDHDRAGVPDPIALPDDQRARLRPTVEAYLAVQVALAEDDVGAARQAALAVGAAAAAVELEQAEAQPVWGELRATLEREAARLAGAGSIEAARSAFEPLSAALERLLRTLGNPLDAPVQLAYCPMASGSRGASWVQQGEVVDNAYYGAMMRTCGEIRQAVPPGGHLSAPAVPTTPSSHDHHGHEH